MSADEYVKYVTENMLKYFLSSKEERKKLKRAKKTNKDSFSYRWFGIVSILISQKIKARKFHLNE